MAEKGKLDIYSWILSPEIRKAWKKEPSLSFLVRAAIIHRAYRAVEEKLWAILELYARAETEEEKKLGQVRDFYEETVRQMKGPDRETATGKQEPGEVWQSFSSDYDMAEDS